MSAGRASVARVEAMRQASETERLELYLKRGRSRRLVRGFGTEHTQESVEEGYAVRASTARGSFFCAGTGEPSADQAWPEADGLPIDLPQSSEIPRFETPPWVEAPLASESEIRSLVAALDKELGRLLPSARLEHVVVEEGRSESSLANSNGVEARWKSRGSSVSLEASAAPDRASRVRLETVLREARDIRPARLARRLVDLLTVAHDGRPVARDRCEVVVAPQVGCVLLAGLASLFDSEVGERLAAGLLGGKNRPSAALTVVDNGRLAEGLLAAPVDGEGTATHETVLIEAGVYRQPLMGWWESGRGRRVGGCSRRPSWRDQPRVGFTHLHVRPDASVAPSDLVAGMSRGYYLLDCAPSGDFDFARDRFGLRVRGFGMLGGDVQGAVSGVELAGRISSLLSGVRGVGRDLAFQPGGTGLVGSPTLLLGGLEILAAGGESG